MSWDVFEELARRILADREDMKAAEVSGPGEESYRSRSLRLEQQLSAQKQIEETMRAEIRALQGEVEWRRRNMCRIALPNRRAGGWRKGFLPLPRFSLPSEGPLPMTI